MTNEQLVRLLKAQIDTSTAAGLASPQDAEEFIDLSVDQTPVLRELRVQTGIRTSFNLDSLMLGEPTMVAAAEGTAPDAADVIAATRNRKVLTPVSSLAAYDVTFDWLRQNIAGPDRANQQLNELFAKRMGKDVVHLAFMGDDSLDTSSRTNKLLRILDGFVAQMEGDADVHDYVIPANPSYVSQVFPGMVSELPKDYRDQRDMLRFYVSADVLDAYADEIGARATAAGDTVLLGAWRESLMFKGIKLVPVYGLDDGRIVLTLKDNLVIGFGQEMEVGKDVDNRKRLLQVTLTVGVDAKYVEGDAVVLGADD